MPESKFTKSSDSQEEIKLDSALIYADWRQGAARVGGAAGFEVVTAFVGGGAKIEINGKSEKGKKLGKITDTIFADRYNGSFDVSDDIEPGDQIFFEVKLSANGLSGESSRIPVYPTPVVSNMAWSAPEARRGDTVKLTADVEKVESGTEALVTIFEYDADGANDKIAELPAVIENKKLDVAWEYEYHEDVDELPTRDEVQRYGGTYNPPEYFFVVDINGFRAGAARESGLLKFKDYIEIVLHDATGEPKADARYVVHLPDGSTREGRLDAAGRARENGIPPGHIRVEFPDLRQVDVRGGEG